MDVEQPETYLTISPDGATNIPEPKVPRASKKSSVQTILDLAIRRFTVRDGTLQINSKRMPWSAAGQNLRAQFAYNFLAPSYRGDISIQPLHLNVSKDQPLDLGAKVALTIEKNKVTVSSARIETPESSADLSGAIQDFFSPVYLFQYTVRISLPELLRTLRFHTRPEGTILIAGNGHVRADLGVPLYLHAPGVPDATARSVSVGFIEVAPDEARAEPARKLASEHPGFDYLWLTAPVARDDPCKAFAPRR